mmetsp:Transcript_12200/g.20581  ORF Transcript_12200/g.20581 Transcript_12200/m.20581 type:complete len:116 (+) Transcript_12200:367-714(+)
MDSLPGTPHAVPPRANWRSAVRSAVFSSSPISSKKALRKGAASKGVILDTGPVDDNEITRQSFHDASPKHCTVRSIEKDTLNPHGIMTFTHNSQIASQHLHKACIATVQRAAPVI